MTVARGLTRLLARGRDRDPRACAACRHFDDDPWRLEAALPGLNVLSSARASVLGDDGLCARHGRFTGARSRCSAFEGRCGIDPFRQP